MTVIDTINKQGLTQERLQQFVDLVKDEDIDVYKDDNLQLICKKENLVKNFFQYTSNIKEEHLFMFKSSSVVLKFDGANFLWWTKTSKRLEKLESIFNKSEKIERKSRKKKEIIENEAIYSVGIATIVDNELTNIRYFEGPKSKCIEFINDDMFNRYIDESLSAKVVINFAFDINEFNKVFSDDTSKEEKEKYKHNFKLWYTIRELEEMGAITTK